MRAAGNEPPTAGQPEFSPRIAAVSVEIAVHTAILFLILTPLYSFVLPVYYVERGIVDGYAAARLLLSPAGVHLPMVQQIRAEGWAFDQASIVVTIALLLIAAVWFRRKVKRRLQAVNPGAVYGRDGRRYRAIPERLRSGLETELGSLWAMAKSEGPPPRLYCFAAAPVIACALSDGGYPAIAVSAGMLERRMQGPDRLTRLILLHEIGHILVDDQIRLPRLEALVEVLRNMMLGLVGTVSALSSIWAICEKLDVAGLGESGGASAVAYLREIVNPMAFTYLSLIVMTRYISLIVMLLELRADLNAAELDGGIESFISVVGKEPAIRDSGWRGRWKSLFGMKVTHLSPRERVDLLQCTDRLLTPKLRYFAFSLVLPVILLLLGNNGFVASSAKATTAFELVIGVGLTGTVIALNAAVVLAISMAWGARERGLTQKRMLTITAAVIVANLLLFWNESAVISRADVWLTAALDPNFREPWPQSLHHAAALGRELARPFAGPFLDGRMAIWVMTAYASLGLVSRIRVPLNRLVRGGIVAATLFGTLWERLWVNDIPFFQLVKLPGTSWGQAFSRWPGPIIGLEAGLLVALAGAVGAGAQRLFVRRWRARTPALPEQ